MPSAGRAAPTHHRSTIGDEEGGFSLVELMIVVLVLGVLITIAVPAFLGARVRANDRAAQADLRTGIGNAVSIAAGHRGRFLAGDTTVTAAELAGALNDVEKAILWYTPDVATTPEAVTVEVAPDGGAVLLYKPSASGEYFGMTALDSGRIFFCRGPAVADVSGLPGAFDADGEPQSGCSARRW